MSVPILHNGVIDTHHNRHRKVSNGGAAVEMDRTCRAVVAAVPTRI
jgi:hypothetical protein